MRFTRISAAVLAAAVGLAVVSQGASAGIGYDALSSNPGNRWLSFGGTEVGEDTTLDAAAGLVVAGATLRMRNDSITNVVNGTARFSVYLSGGPIPGALLTTAVVPLLMGTNSQMDLYIDLPDTLAPSANLWTTYRFESFTQPATYPLVPYDGEPVIGQTGPQWAFRAVGSPNWAESGSGDGFAWQVFTVPGPSCLWLGAVAMAAGRRRRGRTVA